METRKYFYADSPLGMLTLVKADGRLSNLYLPDHLRGPKPEALGARASGGFEEEVLQLREYFEKKRTVFTLKLSVQGTVFQQRIWDLLRGVPYGETRTYAQLADAIENRGAIRAVGLANGRNPISIIVPCHRVIGSDGSLTGYAGGVHRKQALLELEGVILKRQTSLFQTESMGLEVVSVADDQG